MPPSNAREVLRRSWLLIAAAGILCGLLAGVLSGAAGRAFQSQSVILLGTTAPSTASKQALNASIASEAVFARGDDVEAAIRQVIPDPAGAYDVIASGVDNTLTFIAVAATAQDADALAKAATDAYIEVRSEQAEANIQKQIDAAQAGVDATRQELADELRRSDGDRTGLSVELQEALAAGLTQVRNLESQRANLQEPAERVSFSDARRTGFSPVVSLAGGLMGGATLVLLSLLLRERWSPRVRTLATLSTRAGSHVAVTKPKRRHPLVVTAALRATVERAAQRHGRIYVADLSRRGRAEDVIGDLEATLAHAGRRVATIDGDRMDLDGSTAAFAEADARLADGELDAVLVHGEAIATDEFVAQQLGRDDVVLLITEQHRTLLDELDVRAATFSNTPQPPSLSYLYVHG